MSINATSGSSRSPRADYDLSDPVGSFLRVVRRVALEPTAFFGEIPRRGNLLRPLVFALICILISTVLGGLLRLAGTTDAAAGGGFRFEEGAQSVGGFLASVVLSPIGGTIVLFVLAAVVHLLVMLLVGAGNHGFEATFRVVAYAAVVNLVNWIPVIGGLLGLYGLYLGVVGIREMHATTTGRAALVVLLPIAGLLLLAVLVALVAGAFLLGRFA
jgi:hypothetical protein